MRRIFWSIMLCIFALTAQAQLTFLSRVSPEEEGLRSSDVMQYIDTIMRQTNTDMHGLMILHGGRVIAEKYNAPFAAQYCHTLYSCSKTFTAVAVGLAIQDSLLSLDDHLVDLLPEFLPDTISAELAGITVHDLLTMQSGLPVDTKMRAHEREWIRFYLAQPMKAAPGTLFAYDSISTYLLAAIVQRLEGMKMIDLLKRRIFNPLGITEVAWEESPEGINCGGWGLYMQLESMAKFGQLILQRGQWNGMQLIAAEWIDQMTQVHATNAGGSKYGYQIWITEHPGMVRCDGAYGQYIFVIPDKNMVVAMTQCQRGANALEPSATWQLSRKASATPLRTNTAAYRALLDKEYQLPVTKGKFASLHHRNNIKVRLGVNDLQWKEIEFQFVDMATKKMLVTKVTTNKGESFTMNCGYKRWVTNTIKGYPLNFRPFQNNFSNIAGPFVVGSSYGWTTDDDLYMRLHFANWLTSCRLHFRFTGTGVSIDLLNSHTTKSVRILGEVIK